MRLEFNFLQFFLNKNVCVELEQKMELEPFLNLSKIKRNLKLGTFDHGTFLYKVH